MPVFRTTMGYSGFLVLVPARQTGQNIDGSKVICRSIKLPITRLGIEAGSRTVVGVVNTDNIPDHVEDACLEMWGEDWVTKYEKAVKKAVKSQGLVLIKSTEEIKLETRLANGPKVVSGPRRMDTLKPMKPTLKKVG